MVDLKAEYEKIDRAREELRKTKSYYRRKDLSRFIYKTRQEIAEARRHLQVAGMGEG